MSWQDHYSEMERQVPKEEADSLRMSHWPRPEDEPPRRRSSGRKTVAPKSKAKPLMSKKEIDRILLAYFIREQELRSKEAKRIVKVDPTKVGIDPNSIESFIIKALSHTSESLSLTDIITQTEAIGWDANAFKQAVFASILNDNYHLFSKTNTGFKLREGLRGSKPSKEDKRRYRREIDAHVPTLSDIIVDIAKRHQTSSGVYPSRIHYIMSRIGYDVSYSYVRKVMQSNRFVKNGFFYKPA